jgi:GH25 family lysozyme M1 (1,4-beta-N-acetylmuramidase)
VALRERVNRSPLAFALASIVLVACSAADRGEPTESSSAEIARVCGQPASGPVQGRDVSVYQGNFDWNAQKSAGVIFGYARISDGTGTIDATFDGNWSRMKAAGILRGAYQFFEPGEDETAQANMMVQKVGRLGDGDLPAMIDVEATGGQSPATIAAKIKTWLRIVEQGTGRRPVIYSGAYFWEGSVGDTTLGAYPFWIAAYGPTCPSLPNGWSNWAFWQYSDGNGALDHDVFNGTLAELQAMARPPDQSPRGALDAADCTKIAGWAQDQDTPTQAISVDLHFDGAPGSNAPAERVTAGDNRSDLCAAIGSCNHGFSVPPPRALRDGKAHTVHAYGIDSSTTGQNAEIGSKTFTCAPEALPPKMARRWVTSGTSFADWKFRTLDVGRYTDAELAALPKIADLGAKPSLAQGDDGSPEVWMIDGASKRHVVSPASMASWQFVASAIVKTPAAKLAAMPTGPDWVAAPILVQASGPEVYVLDVDPVATSSDAGTSAPPRAGDDGGAGASDGTSASDGAASSGGCSASGARTSALAWLFAVALVIAARARRSRS